MNNNNFIVLGKFNEILSDKIGEGTRICEWVFIGKDVVIGKNCVISNSVEINSGSVIGDNTNIQSKAVINSNTKIGKHCHIGVHVITADEYHMTPDTETITSTAHPFISGIPWGGSSLLETDFDLWASTDIGYFDNVPTTQPGYTENWIP